MKNRFNLTAAVFLMAFASFTVCTTLLGCKKKDSPGDESKSEKSIIMGFSQIGAESEWRTCNTQSIMQAAQEAGIQVS